MVKTPSKTLVQLGLDQVCEYIYVTKPNWTELSDVLGGNEGYPFIPQEIWDGCVWNYYGVDMREWSIQTVSHFYRNCDYAHFIQAAIVGESGAEVDRDDFRVGRYKLDDAQESFKGVTLNELFFKTGLPDVLVMDIEGCELEVFLSYDWFHKPEFIVVETHTFDACNAILELMLFSGYSLYTITGQTTLWDCNPVFSFLRSDFVSDRIRDFYVYNPKKVQS